MARTHIRVLDLDGEAEDVQAVLTALRGVVPPDGADGAGAPTELLELAAAAAPARPAPEAAVAAVRTCTVCGCTDDRACDGGCSWAELDDALAGDPLTGLCSRCAESKAAPSAAPNGRKAKRAKQPPPPIGEQPDYETISLEDDLGAEFDGDENVKIVRRGRGRHRHLFVVPNRLRTVHEASCGGALGCGETRRFRLQ